MMNKYHWARAELEDRFPVGSMVLYCGKANPIMAGHDGVVTGYSKSGGIKVHFDNCHAVTFPENLTVIPEGTPRDEETRPEVNSDVTHPNHYTLFDNVEAIEIIARSMSIEAFRGFCLGNVLKYQLHTGKKSGMATVEKDLSKAAFYQELFYKYKGLCHDIM